MRCHVLSATLHHLQPRRAMSYPGSTCRSSFPKVWECAQISTLFLILASAGISNCGPFQCLPHMEQYGCGPRGHFAADRQWARGQA
ncbi:hypothetical protein HYPSUDRAFT_1027920 [Hypholoma sublateritium FD-334 SS-4]|uniref:Uncharacterized protein n=1 Tax=Hypholoma sublateritium (strain FD-334 SS-4) TaxID=945553 RepID=A0A0D2Q5B4_HYPSF|nr:hypothetical protein HYPSUDRAFT_1027920 [Hypholoma sublateritium FD-334 SS-4]